MPYLKLLVSPSGEVFPYDESFPNGYLYRISVEWKGREGELSLTPSGASIAFDDDGSWALFPVVPGAHFPDHDRLSEAALLSLLSELARCADEMPSAVETNSREQVDAAFQRFLREGAIRPPYEP